MLKIVYLNNSQYLEDDSQYLEDDSQYLEEIKAIDVWSLHFTTHSLFKDFCPVQWQSGQSSVADTKTT
jgi:hypothetical protein